MSIGEQILELLKYTVPALVVLIAATVIVNKFLVGEYKRKQLAVFQDGQETTLRLRLQAYERLAMFIERAHPRELVPRIYVSGMTVRDLQTLSVASIKTEFEHNLSQQIYVSAQVWNTIISVKEQEIAMINQIAQDMNPDADAKELNARIINFIMTREDATPTEIALEVINNEAKKVMYQQA
ncbi:hypothetical protein DBR32_09495 [Taibaiella sp. KBW10]|uniref:DUF7935 family protein n=1 Tax=Taibaiella sp. KBW10 TaxID=2153357 RepID=UPI000F5AC878|nr:hypothetical protein [Taibaiella sp. KBW10]RQO30935.1 hypothetical protein DBR32_09495 [Taibaiella sp. KBW10]